MNYAIDLDAIEARAKAATPDAVTYSYEGLTRGENPRHQFSICNGTWQDEPTRPHRCIAMVYSDSEDSAPDAEFYANARADVLALLADARAHRTRADAAEAECARLRCAVGSLADACGEADAEADALRAALEAIADGERDVPCLVARPGEGTLECRVDTPCAACRASHRMSALRAIIDGRAEAPDDAEIAVHAAAGGCWLLAWSDGTVSRVRGRGAVEDAREVGVYAVVRWWPLDATGRPTTWPTGGGR